MSTTRIQVFLMNISNLQPDEHHNWKKSNSSCQLHGFRSFSWTFSNL